MDLSKAFDTLSHATLLDKLPQYGIQGTELELFKDYLFCRKQVVSYNGCLSADHNVSTGIPQGPLLGPLLFLVYLNDVIEGMSTQLLSSMLMTPFCMLQERIYNQFKPSYRRIWTV